MSHITFDIQWEEAMGELSKLLEDDDPKVYSVLPKGLQEYSILYIRYIQIYRKLEDCYDQIIHAQKRIDLRKTLEACIGRILELRNWMVSLNDGSEYFDLLPVLNDMKLGSEALEVPHPRFMMDDSNAAIEARRKFVALASEKAKEQDTEAVPPSKFSKEAAIAIIQANERGRQSRQRIAELFKIRKMQEEELQHKHSGGEALSVDAAVRKIQALARGFLERCRVRHSAQDELILIGDQVLLIGTSSKPQDAPSKPAPNLMSLFAKKIYVPYPDYASRVILWRTLLERHGSVLSYNFNLSILAHLSADYSPGSMEAICKLVLTKKRLRKLRSHALAPEELINHFHEFMPLDKATLAVLRTWNKPDPKPEDDPVPTKKK